MCLAASCSQPPSISAGKPLLPTAATTASSAVQPATSAETKPPSLVERLKKLCAATEVDPSFQTTFSLREVKTIGPFTVGVCGPAVDFVGGGDLTDIIISQDNGFIVREHGSSYHVLEPSQDLVGDSQPELVLISKAAEGFGSVRVFKVGAEKPVAVEFLPKDGPSVNGAWAQWGPAQQGESKPTLLAITVTPTANGAGIIRELRRLAPSNDALAFIVPDVSVFPGEPNNDTEKKLAALIGKRSTTVSVKVTSAEGASWAEIDSNPIIDSGGSVQCDNDQTRDQIIVSTRGGVALAYGKMISHNEDFDSDGTTDWVVHENMYCVVHRGGGPGMLDGGGFQQIHKQSLSVILSGRGAPQSVEYPGVSGSIGVEVVRAGNTPAIAIEEPLTANRSKKTHLTIKNGRWEKTAVP